MHIDEEMLSDMLRVMLDVTGVGHYPCTKWVSNLHDKMHYVTRYRYSSISPMDSDWTRYATLSHSLSAPTCCLSVNSATMGGKMCSPTLESWLLHAAVKHS